MIDFIYWFFVIQLEKTGINIKKQDINQFNNFEKND